MKDGIGCFFYNFNSAMDVLFSFLGGGYVHKNIFDSASIKSNVKIQFSSRESNSTEINERHRLWSA